MNVSFEGVGRLVSIVLVIACGVTTIIFAIASAIGAELPLLDLTDDPHAIMLGAIGVLLVAVGVERAVELRQHHTLIRNLASNINETFPVIESKLNEVLSFERSDSARYYGIQEGIYEAARKSLEGDGRGRIVRHAHIQVDPIQSRPVGHPDPVVLAFIRQIEHCINESVVSG